MKCLRFMRMMVVAAGLLGGVLRDAAGQCQVLLKDTFQLGDRPHGGGRLRAADLFDLIRDYWPQVPADGTQWIALEANDTTWRFAVGPTVDSEVPADVTGGAAWADNNATALLALSPQVGAVTMRCETILFGGVAYVGFTSSPALANNFETSGALWLTLDETNAWRLYANGMNLVASGVSVGMGTLGTGYLHMEFTFDPITGTVSGRVQEMQFGPVSVALSVPMTYFGMEAHGGMVTMNNIVVSTGTALLASAEVSGQACIGATATMSLSTNAPAGSIIRWCDRNGSPVADGVLPSGAVVTGAHTSVMTLAGLTGAEFGDFFATVASECGAVISNRVRVSRGTCRVDIDCSGSVSVQDLFDYLRAWFMGSAMAEFDAAAGVGVQDLFEFLGAWFAGCV